MKPACENSAHEFLIDDWGILTRVVPGVLESVLELVKSLTGEPLIACTGDNISKGYRVGTRWLHLFGIPFEVFLKVTAYIDEQKKLHHKEIGRLKKEFEGD